MMEEHTKFDCDVHEFDWQCPDVTIIKYKKGFGIPVRDGGNSFIVIKFCPWCGKNLKEQNGSHKIRSKKSD